MEEQENDTFDPAEMIQILGSSLRIEAKVISRIRLFVTTRTERNKYDKCMLLFFH